jgi:hypothetical protein
MPGKAIENAIPFTTPTGDEGTISVGREKHGQTLQLMTLVEGSGPMFFTLSREAAAGLHAWLGATLSIPAGEPDPTRGSAH